MSATATLLSFSTTTPLEPVAPVVVTRSGRFSPRRRVPSNKQDRAERLRSLEPPALVALLSPPPSSPMSVVTAFAPHYHRQSKQKVRFDLKPIVHQDVQTHNDIEEDENNNAAAVEECLLWYSADDIGRMRQEYQDLALALREQAKLMHSSNNNNNTDNWQQALCRVYQTAARAADVDDLAAVLQQQTTAAPANLRGLELSAVTYIQLDTASRRHRLYARVQTCQVAVRDPVVRAEMLRQCSRTLSRPARLVARHVAVLSSLQQQDKQA